MFNRKSLLLKDKEIKKEIIEVKISPQNIEKIKKEEIKNDLRELNEPPKYSENIMEKLIVENKGPLSLNKSQTLEENIREVVLVEVPQDKNLKNIPAYMDYYRTVREKIRSNAYRFYNGKEKGEIIIAFVILKDGNLEKCYLTQDSVDSEILKEIAIKSIQNAAPFPKFPEELRDRSRLQFNISIYFKNN
jgi:TonB family protein